MIAVYFYNPNQFNPTFGRGLLGWLSDMDRIALKGGAVYWGCLRFYPLTGDGCLDAKQSKSVDGIFGSSSFRNARYPRNSPFKLFDDRWFLKLTQLIFNCSLKQLTQNTFVIYFMRSLTSCSATRLKLRSGWRISRPPNVAKRPIGASPNRSLMQTIAF